MSPKQRHNGRYTDEDHERWNDLAHQIGALEATVELGYPKSGSAVARWADKCGAPMGPPDEDDDLDDLDPPKLLNEDRVRLLAGRIGDSIEQRLTTELYVATPMGVQVQPLTGQELNQIAAAAEKLYGIVRLLDGIPDPNALAGDEPAPLELGEAKLARLERSLGASRGRRQLIEARYKELQK